MTGVSALPRGLSANFLPPLGIHDNTSVRVRGCNKLLQDKHDRRIGPCILNPIRIIIVIGIVPEALLAMQCDSISVLDGDVFVLVIVSNQKQTFKSGDTIKSEIFPPFCKGFEAWGHEIEFLE